MVRWLLILSIELQALLLMAAHNPISLSLPVDQAPTGTLSTVVFTEITTKSISNPAVSKPAVSNSAVSNSAKPTQTSRGIPAPAGVDCLGSSWTPTVKGWVDEQVDVKLKAWWESIPNRKDKNFVTEFGKAFGDFAHNLACGVDTEDQCINPSCKVFRDANAPKWTYFTRIAISNLNRFMRLLHAGIGEGQLGFESLREDMASGFWPWKDTRTDLEKAAPWLAAMFSTAAAFVPFGYAVRGVLGASQQAIANGVSNGGAAFAGAAFAQISVDPSIKPIIGRMRLLSDLGKAIELYCSTARDIWGKWSMSIFKGEKDASKLDILDYLKGGRFVLQDNWTKSDLENFFKKRMVAWFVNHVIKKNSKTFILCANSTTPGSVTTPAKSKYVTNNGTRVCSLYRMGDDGTLKDLVAVNKLAQPQYNITAQDIVQSSVDAYQAHGFGYTPEFAATRLQFSASLPPNEQWFQKGAAAEGVFTISVCDIGTHTEWMGMGLPCCCGIGCEESEEFMNGANMGDFAPVKKKCKETCPSCGVVNYGSDGLPSSRPSFTVLAATLLVVGIANFVFG